MSKKEVCLRPSCKEGSGGEPSTETRINGYCSHTCEDLHDLEEELDASYAVNKALMERIITLEEEKENA